LRRYVLVSCTRCLYGQLVRQRFAPPRRYPMPSPTDQNAFSAAELGMKIVVVGAGYNLNPVVTHSLKAPGDPTLEPEM
jgi:hypothetical protein